MMDDDDGFKMLPVGDSVGLPQIIQMRLGVVELPGWLSERSRPPQYTRQDALQPQPLPGF